MYAASLASMLVLTRLLAPSAFGVYAVLIAVASIGYTLVTVGFLYAMTRSPEQASAADVQAAFWSFEVFYVAVAGCLLAASALTTNAHTHIIMRALAVFFVLAPFRFPAAVRCWRNIELGRFAVIEASEVVVFQATAVGFVLAGDGVSSFGYALVAAAITSAVLAMSLTGWLPARPVFAPLRPWVAKARPYFASGALSLWRDSSHAPLLAIVFGSAVAGFYGWAAGFAVALVALSTVLTQAMFVGFAQVRGHDEVAAGATLALRVLAVFGGAVFAVVAGSAHPITATVFAPKWLPGVGALRLLIAAVIVGSLAFLFINLALADGRVRAANRWLLILCTVTVVIGLPLAAVIGLKGYTGAYLLGSLVTLILAWRQSSRVYALAASLAKYVVLAFACAVLGAFAAWSVGMLNLAPWLSLVASCAAGFIIYVTSLLVVSRGGPWKDVRQMLATLRS